MTQLTDQAQQSTLLNGAPPTAVNCRKCGSALAEEQRYCLQCGSPSELACERLDWLAGVHAATAGPARAATTEVAAVPPQPQVPQPQVPPARPPEVQAAVDRQNEHPRPESRYAIYGAAGATAMLVTALVAGFVGAGLADNDNAGQPIVQAAAVAPAATGATGALETFTGDWPAGENGWTVIVKQFDKASVQLAQISAFKSEVAAKGLEVGALDSDQFGSLDSGQYVVYAGKFGSEKEAKSALKDVKSKGFAEATVAEVAADDAGDSGAESSKTVDPKKLEDLSPKDRLKLPDETTTEGKAPPTDEKDAGGGSDELSIGSLGDHFGVAEGGSGDVVGFDVNSLTELSCVWPLQTGAWTVGRTLKLAPGTPSGWIFPSPVNDFFSGSATAPGATFCSLEEHGLSAALAFKGRYATAAAARAALKKDTEMKALGAHVVRVIPIVGTTPAN